MKLVVLNVAYPFAAVGPYALGGAEQLLTRLDAALAQSGHESFVMAPEGSGSRTLSASWMADSAASVGSFIFGVFAMSVVASLVTLNQVRSPREYGATRHERISLSSPRIVVGQRA